jgi:hypothetical protein
MEYMVLYAETPDALTAKVSAVLGQNWRPCGGIAIAIIVEQVYHDGWHKKEILFYQAMVREGGPPIVIPTSALYT